MKRSFLSRRRPTRHRPTRRRSTRRHKHPRYHHSLSRRLTHRLPRRPHRSLKKRGGAVGETVTTVEGTSVGKNVVITNSKGMSRSLKEYQEMLNADTSREIGDDV
jgi:hypothetical protein